MNETKVRTKISSSELGEVEKGLFKWYLEKIFSSDDLSFVLSYVYDWDRSRMIEDNPFLSEAAFEHIINNIKNYRDEVQSFLKLTDEDLEDMSSKEGANVEDLLTELFSEKAPSFESGRFYKEFAKNVWTEGKFIFEFFNKSKFLKTNPDFFLNKAKSKADSTNPNDLSIVRDTVKYMDGKLKKDFIEENYESYPEDKVVKFCLDHKIDPDIPSMSKMIEQANKERIKKEIEEEEKYLRSLPEEVKKSLEGLGIK